MAVHEKGLILYLTEQQHAALKAAAEARGVSMNQLIRQALFGVVGLIPPLQTASDGAKPPQG